MISRYVLFTLLGCCVVCTQGCSSDTPLASTADFREPAFLEQLGVKPDTPRGKRRGYLSDMAMQHPSISERDHYLDLYDKKGNWLNQIVIIFAEGVSVPTDRTRPIEVSGRVGHIDMGGPPGTKSEYANDAVIVESWRHLTSKEVPRKRTVEPEDALDKK